MDEDKIQIIMIIIGYSIIGIIIIYALSEVAKFITNIFEVLNRMI